MRSVTSGLAALGAAGAFAIAVGASGATYSFTNITGNSVTDAAAGESQLRVDVIDFGGGQVLFEFYHAGVTQMTISEIYFDDGHLLGIASIIDRDTTGETGVDFSQGANPPNLPGGQAVNFNVTAGFLADADNPAPKWGVGVGERIGIVFNLINGFGFTDVIEDLADGSLRIGMHVIAFGGGGSESFIHTPPTIIPLPAPALLGLAGLAPIAIRRRR